MYLFIKFWMDKLRFSSICYVIIKHVVCLYNTYSLQDEISSILVFSKNLFSFLFFQVSSESRNVVYISYTMMRFLRSVPENTIRRNAPIITRSTVFRQQISSSVGTYQRARFSFFFFDFLDRDVRKKNSKITISLKSNMAGIIWS